MPPDTPPPSADDDAARLGILALREAALRATTAGRFLVHSEERLLQLIVDAAVSLFSAEAASIALFERDPDRLEFRVAGGAHGAEVIGMSVTPTEGIIGYVFSTGESVALSDITTDPRFDRQVAERTGYVPRSVAAVPLVSEGQIVGVLQALDKQSGETFSPRDMELLAAFAGQAGAAIAGTRVQHDLPTLLATSLAQLDANLTDEQVQALVSGATAGLDEHSDSAFWALVDQVSRLRDLGESELELVGDILEVVARHQSHRGRFGRR
jgi:GAF domain-containing protein